MLINADDYYGPRVFERLAAHLRAAPGWAVAAFRLADTLTPHGPVNRALCDVGAGNRLEDLREWTSIRCDGRRLLGTGPDGKTVALDSDRRVSMNAWALRPDVFPVLELGLVEFLSGRPGGPDEYHLPDAIARAVRSGARSVSVIDAGERWLGITYPEDIERIAQTLSEQS